MPSDTAIEVEAAGREVTVSSPDKVFFDERGETKLDLIRYYLAVEPPLMRALGGRPVLMERYPNGASGSSFFQKRIPKNPPDWLQSTEVQTVNGTPSQALVIGDIAHVVWAVNLGCLALHAWPFKAADAEHADELRIDLDPSPGVTFDMVREGAARTRDAARRAGPDGIPEDDRPQRHPHLPAAAAPLRLDRGSRGGRRPGPRVGAAAPGGDDVAVVEGGARPARVRRLQPERAAQDGARRLERPPAARRRRSRRHSPGTSSRPSTRPS